ncbi:MAG: sugar transferase, partial [Candidatus Aerophobetes bacterium]|nr:sugar transferase [Candidatus Aerophobetes bacterium]
FALGVLLLFSPLMLLIAIIIKMDSRGPVLYRQKRVGMKGEVYQVCKFRSMFYNAEERTGPVLARRDDERETKVGRFLRRLHLDELPQFLNILRGEMSLIGPRPERPIFVKDFEKNVSGYSRRFLVRPGIAGLAQLYGSYDTSPENKLKYDLTYINNWSLALDLKIFFMSLEIILTRRM